VLTGDRWSKARNQWVGISFSDLIGQDAQYSFAGHRFRGPIEKISRRGNHVVLSIGWKATLLAGDTRWFFERTAWSITIRTHRGHLNASDLGLVWTDQGYQVTIHNKGDNIEPPRSSSSGLNRLFRLVHQ